MSKHTTRNRRKRIHRKNPSFLPRPWQGRCFCWGQKQWAVYYGISTSIEIAHLVVVYLLHSGVKNCQNSITTTTAYWVSTMPNLLEASRLQFFPRLKSRGSNSIFFLRIRTFAGRILVELQSNAGDLLGRIYYYEELLHFDCEATANYRQNLHLKSRKQHGNWQKWSLINMYHKIDKKQNNGSIHRIDEKFLLLNPIKMESREWENPLPLIQFHLSTCDWTQTLHYYHETQTP